MKLPIGWEVIRIIQLDTWLEFDWSDCRKTFAVLQKEVNSAAFQTEFQPKSDVGSELEFLKILLSSEESKAKKH